MKTARLAIISTHPIQYNAPLFSLLAKSARINVKVFYTWSQSESGAKYDAGFGKIINWDIPLLEGYEYEFVENVSPSPGVAHFKGIDNPGLISKISAYNPTALLVYGWSYKSHLAAMRHFKGKVPVIFRGDSTLLDEGNSIKKILRRVFLKWIYRHVDYALYVGSNNKEYFLKHGLKESQLILAHHAIDNDRFRGSKVQLENEAAEWRTKLGISESDFVFLFAGKLENKKNPAFIIEMADKFNDSQTKFLLVGNGELEQELKEKANKSNVIFLDFQNQEKMPLVYRLGNAFILPSVGPGETWGLAINEAMACGRAVIASDKCGGAIDLIKKGYNGYVFSYSNLNGFSNEIADVKKNAEQMGNNSLKKIEEFSFANIVAAIESLIEKL
jgi:glycosyltransferase involved in cell wall biosynthesis